MATTNTTGTTIDFRLIEAVGTVLISSIEEQIVSMTYGMTRLLRQGLETQPLLSLLQDGAQALPSQDALSLSKLAAVLAELQQRTVAVHDLAARVTHLEEASAQAVSESSESSTIAVPEVRLHAIEDSLNSVELLAGGLGQQDQGLHQLNQRLSTLESLLHSLSNLPEAVGRQSQIISHLDQRLSRLEAKHLVDQSLQEREIEPERVS